MELRIPAALMRGGTSRALVFRAQDLPDEEPEQDAVFLAAMGSPDPTGRQVNGVGGGSSTTSKIAVLAPSERPGIDVDYTFCQVELARPAVERAGNCGNISSVAGPFALDEGWVAASEPLTTVRIYNTNTGKTIVAHVPTAGGRFDPEGTFEIPGVPGTGSKIVLDYLDPGGSVTGRLLPTGSPRDALAPSGERPVEASIVDAGNPLVYVRAEEVGIEADALPAALDRDTALLARLEAIRRAASVAAGLSSTLEEAGGKRSIPKLAAVARAQDYRDATGVRRGASEVDLVMRSLSMGRFHPAFQLTGAVCTAAAAAIPGTVVNEALPDPPVGGEVSLRIGHPAGVLEVAGRVARDAAGAWVVEQVSVARTARRIMDGWILVSSQAVGSGR